MEEDGQREEALKDAYNLGYTEGHKAAMGKEFEEWIRAMRSRRRDGTIKHDKAR